MNDEPMKLVFFVSLTQILLYSVVRGKTRARQNSTKRILRACLEPFIPC